MSVASRTNHSAVIASAPGRVNLIGEHTDYNGGRVLPIAIAQRTTVRVERVGAGESSQATTTVSSEVGTFSVESAKAVNRWWDYVAGVAVALRREGVPVPEFRIHVSSDLPVGAGLSSSAALEVAAGLALATLAGHALMPEKLAQLGAWVERDFVGVATGIMDQLASAVSRPGHGLYLDCATGRFDFLPFPDAVLIFDTGVTRGLADSLFNVRRDECTAALELLRRAAPLLSSLGAADLDLLGRAPLPEPLDRRARHVVTETRRVELFAAALRQGLTPPAELLYESHASLRDDYGCSSPELDWFVDHAARTSGVGGARLTGAGWGGCAIAIGPEPVLRDFAPHAVSEYGKYFPHHARTWITYAEEGAHVDRIEHG